MVMDRMTANSRTVWQWMFEPLSEMDSWRVPLCPGLE